MKYPQTPTPNLTAASPAPPISLQSDPLTEPQAVPQRKTRLEFVEGLRGFAALWIFLFHCALFTKLIHVFAKMWVPISTPYGVNIFLVISGFVLYLPLAKDPNRRVDARDFIKRRIRRIYPPYFVALCLFTIAAAVITARGGTWLEGPDNLRGIGLSFLMHALMLHSFSPPFILSLDHPLWTLGLEASFYVTFPVLVALVKRYSLNKTFVLIVTLSLATNYAITAWVLLNHVKLSEGTSAVWHYFFLMRWPEFMCGMLAADAVARHNRSGCAANRIQLAGREFGWSQLAAFSVGTFLLGFGLGNFQWLVPFRAPLLGVSASLFLLAGSLISDSEHRNPVGALLTWRPLVAMGAISYSFYLIHQPLLRLMMELPKISSLPGKAVFVVSIIVFLPVLLVLATVYNRLVERPFAPATKT